MDKLYIYMWILGSVLGVSGSILNITIPVKLNSDASLPCRLPPDDYEGFNVRWSNTKHGWLTSGTHVYKQQNVLSVRKPAPNEWNLHIRKVSMSFEDIYTCTRDTGKGDILSYVKLIIETSPKIDEIQSSPKQVKFEEKTMAALTCIVSGSPEPEIKWYRGKEKLQEIGITGPELIIRDVTRFAADDYLCRATNKNGEAERRMRVTVNFDPEVTVMEPEIHAAGGEVVAMSCVVQASPLHDAYWVFGTDVNNQKIIANWKYLVMVEEGGDDLPVRFLTLIIRKSILTHKDYGSYTCVARGDNAVAKDTVELKQFMAGYFLGVSGSILNITLTEQLNRDATLPCRLPMDEYEGVNVRWFNKKDGWLTSGISVHKHKKILLVLKPAPNEWNLHFKSVYDFLEDTYICKGDNDDILSNVKFIVETPPKIDEIQSSPEAVKFQEKTMATLTCIVSGTPKPEIKWYRGKQEQEIGITGPELIIRDITRYATDHYLCRATNKCGKAERRMRVTVNFAPEVSVMEPEVHAAGGEVVVMSCVVQASPLYDAYWTDVNNDKLVEGEKEWKYLIMVEDDDDLPVRFLTLIIKRAILSHQDYGSYTCVAWGDNTVAKDTVELKKFEAESTVKGENEIKDET